MKRAILLSAFAGLMTSLTFALNHSGTISANETWFTSDNPHVITGNLTVANGATLLIQPGCEIYFNGNYRITVQGVLSANGTESSHILFTSNQPVPAKGDWRFIYFDEPDSGSLMNYCDIQYGGSVATRGMINFRNASNGLIISNCTLDNSGSYGFEYRNNAADPLITDCYISNANNYPVYTYANRVKDLSGLTINGNMPEGIYVRTQNVTTGTWQNFGVPYIIGGNFTVIDGATLTINAGNTLKFEGARVVTVEGALIANGTSSQRIVFTSNQPVPASGDWNRIYFNGADVGCALNYCDILYGGSQTSALDINASGTNVSVYNTLIENSAGYGVYVRSGSSPSFINTSIRNNIGIGIYIAGASAPTFGSSIAQWNDIYGNGTYQLRNGSLNISARYIYWGVGICGNVGDAIFDKADQNNLGIVSYEPFLGADHQLPSFLTTWTGASSPLWNDDLNWDNGVPCAAVSAVISNSPSNQPIVVFNEECKDLTIEGGAQLTIFTGSNLQVNGNFHLKANASGTASFIPNGGFSVAGTTTSQYYVTADRWHYLSTPMTNQVANTFLNMYLYSYNETTDLWDNIVDVNTPLGVGRGYKVWSSSIYPLNNPPGTKSVDYAGGTLNNGNYFLPVTYTGAGWNLVANPYPSAIDWDNAGWIKSKISSTIYVWNGVQYITWNGSVGDLVGGVIPSMQGFFVKATGTNPLLVVSNSTRVHGVDPYKESSVDQLLEISVAGNGYADKTFINFNQNATSGFDDEFDGYKMYGIEEAPQLYSLQNENKLRVNVLPEISAGLFIPVGLEVPAPAEYTMIFNGMSSFEEGVRIFLEDLKENLIVDLASQTDYTFIASPFDNPDRFLIHFGVLGISDEKPLLSQANQKITIYSSENSIYIRNNEENDLQGDVVVYNIMGQVVLSKKLENTNIQKIDLFTETGYYVVKLFTSSGSYAQKVFIK